MSHAPGAWATQRTLAVLAFACLYWVSRFIFPSQTDYHSLDPSWSEGTAEAFKRGMQAGVDWLFTSGPLGWIVTGTYDATLIVKRMVLGEGLFKGLIALTLSFSALRIPGSLDRALYMLALLLVPPNIDAQVFLTVLAIGVWLAHSERPNPWLTALAYTTLVLASMVKFTFLLAAHFTLVIVIASFWMRRDRRTAWRLALAWLITLSCAWIACGQWLWNLPLYMFRALSVAFGYAEAMSSIPKPESEALAFAVMALAAGLFAAAAWFTRARAGRHAALLLAVGLFYLAYQAGFVRGSDHTEIFFCFAITAPFLVVPDAGLDRVSRFSFPVLRGFGAWYALLGLMVAIKANDTPLTELGQRFARFTGFQWESLLDLRERKATADKELVTSRQTWDLPRTREIVGNATIDMMSYEQGMLFLNGLNWHPRPMIQGYSAYTPLLARLNAEFMAGSDAPRFVLFRLQSIDERLQTGDDALALEVLLRDYEPRLIEREWTLYEQVRRTGMPPKREIVFETQSMPDETVVLPELQGAAHVLEVDVRFTLRGKLLAKLSRPPAIWLEIECTDGSKLRRRLLPSVIREGALIDPVLLHDDGWIGWITGAETRRPKKLRVSVAAEARAWVKTDIAMRLRRADDLAPRPGPKIERRELWAILRNQPIRVESTIGPSAGRFRDEPVVVVHAPTRMAYRLLPGHYRLELKYGILDGAGKAGSDGVVFRAGLGDGQKVRNVFEHALELDRKSPDPGMQSRTIEFDTKQNARLLLEADPGPRKSNACDWAFWREVRLDRVGDPR